MMAPMFHNKVGYRVTAHFFDGRTKDGTVVGAQGEFLAVLLDDELEVRDITGTSLTFHAPKETA